MSTRPSPFRARPDFRGWGAVAAAVLLICPVAVHAQTKKKNPVSKIYVSDVRGDASIDTGETLEDLNKRSVYNAQGTVIETKKSQNENDKSQHYSTMVYSNGTGAFFDEDTRVEVRQFMQEPFTPNRNDVDLEPSISQTQAFVARGAVGLCTSKLVAGSNMTYQTPLGSVNIRGRKVVIEARADVTKISMLEGESTVRGGMMETGGHTLHAGEQAVIRSMGPGQPNQVVVSRIPPEETSQLDDKVAMACMAKKTVYFEVRERPLTGDRKSGSSGGSSGENGNGNSGGGNSGGGDSGDGAGGSGGNNGGNGGSGGPVTAFDGNSASSGSGAKTAPVIREIVPVEIVTPTLPTEYTVSPSRLTTPGR